MGKETDARGNYHDSNGRFVNLQVYVERIFDEKDKSAEFARQTLEKSVTAAAIATREAMQEAKVAADARNEVLEGRIKTLESGGAPFASRLDDSLTRLKGDVDDLKTQAVRTSALDALREQQDARIETNRKAVRLAFITATFSLIGSLIVVVVTILTR